MNLLLSAHWTNGHDMPRFMASAQFFKNAIHVTQFVETLMTPIGTRAIHAQEWHARFATDVSTTCLTSHPVHSFSRIQFMSHNLLRHWWHQSEQSSTRMTCKVRNGCVNEMTMKQCFLLRKNLEKHHWWAHACCLTKKMLFLKHHIGSMWSGCLCAHFASQCWCGWTMHCMSTKSVIPLNVSITSVDLSHHLLKMAVLEWQVTFPGDLILVWKTVSFVRSIAQNKHERMG